MNRGLAAVGLVTAVGLAGGACAVDLEQADPPRTTTLVWADPAVDLTGLATAVGSKRFTEQEVLGSIAVEALRAAGAEVISELGRGGTVGNREAQLSGLVDLYWEYTDVGWLDHLQESNPSTDPVALWEDVRDQDLEENDITWLVPAPANRGYAVAMGPTGEEFEIARLADIGEAFGRDDQRATLCVADDSSFIADPEGLRRLQRTLTPRIPADGVTTVEADLLFTLMTDGPFCPFSIVAATDSRVATSEVTLLEDDEQALVPAQPAVTIRSEVAAEAPDLVDLFDPVSSRLTSEVLRELNRQVDTDGLTPAQVARTWLLDEGLIVRP